MVLLVVTTLLCAAEPARARDVFLESTTTRAVGEGLQGPAAELLKTSVITATEPRWGVPTVLWAARPPVGTRSFRAMGLTPAQAARRYLYAYAPLYRFEPAQLAAEPIADVHEVGTGAVLVRVERRAAHPVLRHALHVVMNRELELVGITGALPPMLATARFRLTPETAIATATQALTGVYAADASLRRLALGAGGWAYHDVAGGLLTEPPRVRAIFFATDTALVSAYQLELSVLGVGTFGAVISAEDGQLLSRHALTDDATHSYRVWAQSSTPFTPLDGPHGGALSPYPLAMSAPFAPLAFAPASLVTLDHAGASLSDPWLPSGAGSLAGNNTEAFVDLYPPVGFNDPDAGLPRLPDGGFFDGGFDSAGRPYTSFADVRVVPSGLGRFDFSYDVDGGPTDSLTQLQGAATHAFFVTNWLHDTFYEAGFTEARGNAQLDNFGRGGLAGDALTVHVDESASRNGASLDVRGDGAPPHLRLGVYDFNAPSTLQVIAPFVATFAATPVAPHARAFSVTGDAVRVVTADGGNTACGPYVNAAALAGSIAVATVGPCAPEVGLRLATDAGAVGLLFAGAPSQPLAVDLEATNLVPAQLLAPAAAQAVLDALDAGVPFTATMTRAVTPDRPSALDSTIVMHEWVHLVSERLVGDGSGLLNTQGTALAEGWSDFAAVLLIVDTADGQASANANWAGSYAVGAYVAGGEAFDGATNSAALTGLRRYPLSTDLAKNPLTFKHIGSNVPLPTTPAVGWFPVSANNAERHNAGEVWATMLWEAAASLLRDPRYTVAQAKQRMLQHLVAALEGTPVLPTFLEARDALLMVAFAADPSDAAGFRAAFARRGLGVDASAADRRSTTNTPLAEDTSSSAGRYTLVDVKVVDDGDACDHDGVLDNDESGTLTVRLMNVGAVPLSATRVTLRSNNPGLTIDAAPSVVPPSAPYEVVTLTTPVTAVRVASSAPVSVDVSVTLTDSLLTAPQTLSAAVRMNADVVASSSEDFESGATSWTSTWVGAVAWEATWQVNTVSAATHSMRAAAPGATGDLRLTSPPLHVGPGAFGFTFRHTYLFEATPTNFYDGAVLELSTDGETFTQVPGSALSPGYDGPLEANTSNPLAGRQAFRGLHPTATTQTVALGTQYANRTVWVRFRVGTDASGGREGWSIDDVAFTGLTDTPFTQVVGHRAMCANHAPTITSSPDLMVEERAHVTLVPGQATDRDRDPLTYTWSQRSGPSVTLTGAEFDAPEVSSRTELGFHLVVEDGRGGTVGDDVIVTIRNVNRAPEASAGQPQTVLAGATVTLDGSASLDADGDHLSFVWVQTGGPAVTLAGSSTATPTFIAPEVAITTDFAFSLTVDDAEVNSAPSVVSVTVQPAPKGCGCATLDALPFAWLTLALAARRRAARHPVR